MMRFYQPQSRISLTLLTRTPCSAPCRGVVSHGMSDAPPSVANLLRCMMRHIMSTSLCDMHRYIVSVQSSMTTLTIDCIDHFDTIIPQVDVSAWQADVTQNDQQVSIPRHVNSKMPTAMESVLENIKESSDIVSYVKLVHIGHFPCQVRHHVLTLFNWKDWRLPKFPT